MSKNKKLRGFISEISLEDSHGKNPYTRKQLIGKSGYIVPEMCIGNSRWHCFQFYPDEPILGMTEFLIWQGRYKIENTNVK